MKQELLDKVEKCQHNLQFLSIVELMILKDCVEDELVDRGY